MNNFIMIFIILLPMLGAILGPLVYKKNEKVRNVLNLIITGTVFVLVCSLYKEAAAGTLYISIPHVMGTGLQLKLDMFRYIFVLLTSFIWFVAVIYSTQYLIKFNHRSRYYAFFIFTLGATIGVFMSENILNLFTFFEAMTITSYVLIIHDEDKYTHEAGLTYLGMSIAGGLVLLLGIFLIYDKTNTLAISEMGQYFVTMSAYDYLMAGLLIAGFGVKASIFPLHIWVPKVYASSPAPSSAVLAGVLKKTGVFGMMLTSLVIFKGDANIALVLIILGFVNMLLGGFFGIFQRNIKMILAYSSISQAGYIFLGIGLVGLLGSHGATAFYGVILHIINHGLFKVLLFLGAGVIYVELGDVSINEIIKHGYKNRKIVLVFLIGMLGLVGFPGLNGYVSKTLIHEGLLEISELYGEGVVSFLNVLFIIASSFTTAYMIKIMTTLIQYNNENKASKHIDMSKKWMVYVALAMISAVMLFIGLGSNYVIELIEPAGEIVGMGHLHTLHLFEPHALIVGLEPFVFGVLIYLMYIKIFLFKQDGFKVYYINPTKTWISLEKHIYVPVFIILSKTIVVVFRIIDKFILRFIEMVCKFFIFINEFDTVDAIEHSPAIRKLRGSDDKMKEMMVASIGKFEELKEVKTVNELEEIEVMTRVEATGSLGIGMKVKLAAIKGKEKNPHEVLNRIIQKTKIIDKEETKKLFAKIKMAHTDINSITYSIYLVAIVLIITIGYLLFTPLIQFSL